jgi:hypothetical protein
MIGQDTSPYHWIPNASRRADKSKNVRLRIAKVDKRSSLIGYHTSSQLIQRLKIGVPHELMINGYDEKIQSFLKP